MDFLKFIRSHHNFPAGVYYNPKTDDMIALEHVPYSEQISPFLPREFKVHVKRKKAMQCAMPKKALEGYIRIGRF